HLYLADNAYNFAFDHFGTARIHGLHVHARAYRVPAVKIVADELLIHDCHLRGSSVVVLVEWTPRGERDAKRAEIIGADDLVMRGRHLAIRRRGFSNNLE